jgi:hypothetical protein
MSSSPAPERHATGCDAKTRVRAPSRPRSESRQRTALVAVRLLPQERDMLAETARSRGITLSELIRASAMRAARAPAAEAGARLPRPGLVPRSSASGGIEVRLATPANGIEANHCSTRYQPLRRSASMRSSRPQDADLPIPRRAGARQAWPTVIQTAPATHKTRPTGPGLTCVFAGGRCWVRTNVG